MTAITFASKLYLYIDDSNESHLYIVQSHWLCRETRLKTIDAAIIPQEIANDFGNEELFKQLQALNKKCKQKVRLVKNSVFELSDENDIDINDDTDDNKDDEKKKDMDTDNDIDSSYETESETNVFDGTVLKTHNSRKRKQLKNVEDDVINITESDDDDDVDEEIDVNML
eukprot:94281_1